MHRPVDRLVIDQAAFLSAYLRAVRRGTKTVAYSPRKLTWFTVQDALKRLGSLLGSMPDWTSLEAVLCPRTAALRATRWNFAPRCPAP